MAGIPMESYIQYLGCRDTAPVTHKKKPIFFLQKTWSESFIHQTRLGHVMPRGPPQVWVDKRHKLGLARFPVLSQSKVGNMVLNRQVGRRVLVSCASEVSTGRNVAKCPRAPSEEPTSQTNEALE